METASCRRLREREGAVATLARDEGLDVISLAPSTKLFLASQPIESAVRLRWPLCESAADDRCRSVVGSALQAVSDGPFGRVVLTI
jgi:hypothetical protein